MGGNGDPEPVGDEEHKMWLIEGRRGEGVGWSE